MRGLRASALAATSALIVTGAAAAARTDADVGIQVTAAVSNPPNSSPQPIENGGTRAIQSLTFFAGVALDNTGPDAPNVRISFELPPGLSWGSDVPDPSEGCVGTATTATCESPTPVGRPGPLGWMWDVVASAPGSYVLRAQILSSSSVDANQSNNSATATVVVTPRPPVTTASSVVVTPRRPRAGTVVTARVRVAVDGEPVVPTAVTCRAQIGRTSLRGTARASSGAVTCAYRTRRSHRGRTLRGTIVFSASDTPLTRRFSVLLR